MIRPSTNVNDTRAILPIYRVSRFTVQDLATTLEDGTGDGSAAGGGGSAAQQSSNDRYILTSTGLMFTGAKRDREETNSSTIQAGSGNASNTTEADQHKQMVKQLHQQQQNNVTKNRLMKLKRRVEASAGARPVRSAEAVIVMHDHGHPHVLMLRYHTTIMVPQNRGEQNHNNRGVATMRNVRVGQVSVPSVTYNYRLPGGTCRENETEVACLLRKLGRRLLGFAKEPKNSHLPTGCSEFDAVDGATNNGAEGGGGSGLQAGIRVPISDGLINVITTQQQQAAGGAASAGDANRMAYATPSKKQQHQPSATTVPSTPPQRPSTVTGGSGLTPSRQGTAEEGNDETVFSLGEASPTQNGASSPHKAPTPARPSLGVGGGPSSPLSSQIFSSAGGGGPTGGGGAAPTAVPLSASSSFIAAPAPTVPHVTVYSAAAKAAAEYFRISQVLSTWYRPAYDRPMYPYCPAHIVREKESRHLFLVVMGMMDDACIDELRFTINPDVTTNPTATRSGGTGDGNNSSRGGTGAAPPPSLMQPRVLAKSQVNPQGAIYDLVAVPLFDLYNNASKYGTIAESIPHVLSRFNMKFDE